jgi:hypothetical protein
MRSSNLARLLMVGTSNRKSQLRLLRRRNLDQFTKRVLAPWNSRPKIAKTERPKLERPKLERLKIDRPKSNPQPGSLLLAVLDRAAVAVVVAAGVDGAVAGASRPSLRPLLPPP